MKRLFFFVLALAALIGFCSIGIAQAGPPKASKISFAWDANTEEDLAGYRFYYGNVSRYDQSVLNVIPAIIEEACGSLSEGSRAKTNCVESWQNYCDTGDPACDKDFFAYDSQTDVGNVLIHTIEDLPDGRYFFAVTAYDQKGNESKFSKQLEVIIDSTAPGIVVGFSGVVESMATYKVTIEGIKPIE